MTNKKEKVKHIKGSAVKSKGIGVLKNFSWHK